MKKMNVYLMMMMAMMAMTVFTSCDDYYYDSYDSDDAYTLQGTWTGYIETYFYDRFGKSGDSYRTTMYFERENRYGGWGYEVDYNLNSRYSDYYYCEFYWEVVNGDIRVRYADSYGDVWLYPQRLTNHRFAGWMDDGTNRDIYFDLTYDGAFDWSYWTRGLTRAAGDSLSYKAAGEFAKTDSVAAE